MTNREKWFASMIDQTVVDNAIEDFICRTFVTPTKAVKDMVKAVGEEVKEYGSV